MFIQAVMATSHLLRDGVKQLFYRIGLVELHAHCGLCMPQTLSLALGFCKSVIWSNSL